MTQNSRRLARAIKDRPLNSQGEKRKLGIEIEFAGIDGAIAAEQITALFGGNIEWNSPFDIRVPDSDLGEFKIELDSQSIKSYGESSGIEGDPSVAESSLAKTAVETIGSIAQQLVPWEAVSPPIELSEVHRLLEFVEKLRESGAKGTKQAIHFAFGVHLNPELTDLSATTICNHLKAYFCMYDWLERDEQPDIARRLTPFIEHFKQPYIEKVVDPSYQPDQKQLIGDYLNDNPTRNRSLDMLPLFAFLSEKQVKDAVDDERINKRPTFHYRLPNCEIAIADWNLDRCIDGWMLVEELAQAENLHDICEQYLVYHEAPANLSNDRWIGEVDSLIKSQFV